MPLALTARVRASRWSGSQTSRSPIFGASGPFFGLTAMDPKLVLYGTDPGFTGAQDEANLDVEWSGAIAPKATVYYVYGEDAFVAWSVAVSGNFAAGRQHQFRRLRN